MSESPFLDKLDEYSTAIYGCYDLGMLKIVIAIGDAQADTPGAEAFIERCGDFTARMDILIEVLPDAKTGDRIGDRVAIRYREPLSG